MKRATPFAMFVAAVLAFGALLLNAANAGPFAISGGSSGLTAGTTTITSGTNTRVLFNDSGVVGEDGGLTYVKATDTLTVSGSVNTPNISLPSGTTTFTNSLSATAVAVVNPTTPGGDRNGLALASNAPLAWASANDTPTDPAAWDVALKRNAASVLEVVKSYTANDYGDLKARYVITNPTTVAGLATCNGAAKGTRSFVTDANSTTFLATAAGGGANNVPVVCDGTNWVIG